jgi:hypothetical protein
LSTANLPISDGGFPRHWRDAGPCPDPGPGASPPRPPASHAAPTGMQGRAGVKAAPCWKRFPGPHYHRQGVGVSPFVILVTCRPSWNASDLCWVLLFTGCRLDVMLEVFQARLPHPQDLALSFVILIAKVKLIAERQSQCWICLMRHCDCAPRIGGS